MPNHVVQQGECLSSIAKRYGIAWKTIWEHASNQALRELRKSPNVLYAGDSLFVPELTQKQVKVTPKATHTFKIKAAVSKLRLCVLAGGKPVKSSGYTLSIDGVDIEPQKAKKTDGKGLVIADVAPGARAAVVAVPAQKTAYEIQLGHLDPLAVATGLIARLRHLGYYPAPEETEDDELLAIALWLFQHNHDLTPTGKVDKATLDALEKAYGT